MGQILAGHHHPHMAGSRQQQSPGGWDGQMPAEKNQSSVPVLPPSAPHSSTGLCPLSLPCVPPSQKAASLWSSEISSSTEPVPADSPSPSAQCPPSSGSGVMGPAHGGT